MKTRELYRRVYLIRAAENAIVERYASDQMKTPVHLSLGQEAIAAGVCYALGDEAELFGSYRSHGIYLARTLETDGFFAELYGRATGVCGGKAGSMHLTSRAHRVLGSTAVVATQIPVACGAALAHHLRGDGRWVAVFFGDGAIDEGVFYETLNFASLHGLRLMLVCEDNGLAIHTSGRERHGYDDLARIASGFRCEVARSESTVADEIFDVTVQARSRAEALGRPLLLHLHCYRYLEHVGTAPDFAAGYRDARDAQPWKLRDPVVMQRALLRGLVSEDAVRGIESAIDDQIARSIARAEAAPFPEPEALWADVLAPAASDPATAIPEAHEEVS